jgi:hypothetical protein
MHTELRRVKASNLVIFSVCILSKCGKSLQLAIQIEHIAKFPQLLESQSMSSNYDSESVQVDNLTAMMGTGVLDPETARRVLRKFDGDVQKAAMAILEGDRGEEKRYPSPAEGLPARPQTPQGLKPQPAKQARLSPIIDLTASDDEDLSRALKASLVPAEPKFGPSNRAPDPNWAVVPSIVFTNRR